MTFCLDKLFGFNSPILSIAEFWNQMRMERQKMEQHQPYQLFKSSWLFQLSTMTMSIFSCFLYLLFSLVFFFHVSDTCINLTPWTWENLIWGFPLGTGGARWDIREDVTKKKNLFGERLLSTHSQEGNVCYNAIILMVLIVYIYVNYQNHQINNINTIYGIFVLIHIGSNIFFYFQISGGVYDI